MILIFLIIYPFSGFTPEVPVQAFCGNNYIVHNTACRFILLTLDPES